MCLMSSYPLMFVFESGPQDCPTEGTAGNMVV
ncbi:hypothetical protein A2U01_0066432, partial [Trifolium medium]|nr:hypothetical protein [Trifolium medium]